MKRRLWVESWEMSTINEQAKGNGNPLQCFCWESPMDREEPGRLWFIELRRLRHDWACTLTWRDLPTCYVLYSNQAARKGNHIHIRASGANILPFQTAETNLSGVENCLNFLRPEDSTSRFLPQNFTNVHRKRFM